MHSTKKTTELFHNTPSLPGSSNYKNLWGEKIYNKVKNTEYFKKIKSTINLIESTGTLYRSCGFCIGASDLLFNMLKIKGIKSKLVECNLTVLFKENSEITFVGQENSNDFDPSLDFPTHVVCITETEVPFLIDLSISHIDKSIKYIFHPLAPEFTKFDKNILSLEFDTSIWTYNERNYNTFIELHENSILNRISTDVRVNKEIKLLRSLVILISVVSSLNFIRGAYDHYQKYINTTNGFGPNKVYLDK